MGYEKAWNVLMGQVENSIKELKNDRSGKIECGSQKEVIKAIINESINDTVLKTLESVKEVMDGLEKECDG